MKVLVIDSHKSSKPTPATNLHWINAKKIADLFGGDLIWSYPTVNDDIKGGYDAIIFIHASHYAYVDYKWLEASPNAKLFYVTNEYNLGEPRALWMAAKAGRRYEVIANHEQSISKLVNKYVDDWHIVNLNSLCLDVQPRSDDKVSGKALYYGSFRKGRVKYFQKYFNSDSVIVSSHKKNHKKFYGVDANPSFIPRINWAKDGLSKYRVSLYLEDEVTHNHYNYLANRFYEALNYGVVPLFDESCINTLIKCAYGISSDYVVNSPEQLKEKLANPPLFQEDWISIAKLEKAKCLHQIATIVTDGHLEQTALEVVNNFGKPENIFHPQYGWIWKDGKTTAEGLRFYKEKILMEEK